MVNAGNLLPDTYVLQLLQKRLGDGARAGEEGVLLDGFPRTRSQAEALLTFSDVQMALNMHLREEVRSLASQRLRQLAWALHAVRGGVHACLHGTGRVPCCYLRGVVFPLRLVPFRHQDSLWNAWHACRPAAHAALSCRQLCALGRAEVAWRPVL